ncbi:hypothetical protein MTR67_051636 [Solanum verrucosum]|uniref:Reverse transcriptase domain-containing protein n=1 Tax=Solanum verrucosum TaxID=315347 RepID=A0AAF0V7N6_SOLVR|nr:hypothetical protein MTR67_051636 [Solanum verrucosum]
MRREPSFLAGTSPEVAHTLGCPDYILNIKLRMLKQKLKEWSKSNFGELTSKKNSLLEELAEIDLIQETRELTEDEVIIRATIVVELEELAKNEESKWRQKSRVLWLKQGDNNTRFFQRMATAHRRINTIDRLIDRGEVVEDPVEIRNTVINFYKELYTESEEWRPNFDLMECPTISQEEKDWMQRPFTESEVLQCLQLCDGDKAPGPDGYTMSFFKSCWGIVKEDLMLTIHNFHQNGIFEKSFNATFLALIPKKPGAKELKDFRPISLIGGVYKIISKLITERLKTVMGKLVDVHQMAFLKGRQIMDAALIVNELVDSRVKQKIPGILCKLDIEKAYDHVNWAFLLKVLKDMGFGRKWLNWIKFCISTVKFSLIINGNSEGFFQSQRGLRQGDPLSPFLFLLAMEGLNHMIRKANVNGWIKGFKAQNQGNRDNEVGITHLLYADDTLVFCEAEVIQIRHIRAILTIFEGISGLHVNWQKSFLYPVNQVDNMELLARNLGCQIATLPTRYLGMPLGAQNKETTVWSEVLERCNKKLARWKSQYLSLGGRLTLVKSVLDALPSYMMSLFPIPKNIVKKIDQLRRFTLYIYYSSVICQIVFGALLLVHLPHLNPFPGYIPLRSESVDDKNDETILGEDHIFPERYASILSRISFGWITPLLRQGYNRPITEKDVWKLDSWDKTETLSARFQRCWTEESQRKKSWLLRALNCSLGGRFWYGGLFKVMCLFPGLS